MSLNPLAGQRIVVTRAKDQGEVLAKQIKKHGGTPLDVPLIAFRPVLRTEYSEQVVSQLGTYKWLVFTSSNGVRFFMDAYAHSLKEARDKIQIAVVGQKTEQTLSSFGIEADLLPGQFVAEGLATILLPKIKIGDGIIVARGNLGRPFLIEELVQAGAKVVDLTVYETYWPDALSQLEKALSQKPTYITFTSPSTIEHFSQLLKKLNVQPEKIEAKIACIGPVAKRTAIHAGLDVAVMPSTYTTDAMIQAIIEDMNKEEQI